MALYTKTQLAYERSIGLELSDYENEHFYASNPNLQKWSNTQFEEWLKTKNWSAEIKEEHRKRFKGFIAFDGSGGFSYT